MSETVEAAEVEPDSVDSTLRYGAAMVLAALIAGFLAVSLDQDFKVGVALGLPVGILVGWILRSLPDIDDTAEEAGVDDAAADDAEAV